MTKTLEVAFTVPVTMEDLLQNNFNPAMLSG